ncbi:MAG: S8 family serine peptidase [Novosphingobium sp.]|nr:S8 family serine peptidase [Novosphingobium sp.]MCP5403894.1 S8 family serine peptidase [Novosphingobium sp.]
MREASLPCRSATLRLGAAALALALVSGCGGGGGTTNSTPAPAPTPTPTPAPAPAPTPTPTPTPAAVFETDEYDFSDGPAYHGAIAAWQVGATGEGVAIGIVDTGIDTSNPEFEGRISAASADVAGNGTIDDEGGHGTMVALVAAAARDGFGVLGIAWEATIMALRADAPGSCASDDGCAFFDSDIAQGIDEAVQGGAKVINLSLGGSPPNQSVRNAVARAGAAGVVVIVAAGNDADSPPPDTDPTQPDPFAVGLRQAGNGNVIIAGSVTPSDSLSSFSNPAGNEADWYLTALGDRVCCIYENGDLRTFTDENGDTFVFVASGTSFAAPQIAGAAALLFQAFPNLTGQQVVDLLLTTARDVGNAGTDAQFGRGILDIRAAFEPQGTTSLAGSTQSLALADTSMVTSPAMGDAASQGASLQAIVLDRYKRAYQLDLARNLRSAQAPPRLARALIAPLRQVAGGGDGLALAFSVDESRRAAQLPWSGQLRLSAQDAHGAQVLAARVAARLAPNLQLAFGFAQGADGLTAQLQGASGPAFLVAGSPADDLGFVRGDELAFALRRDFGAWGVTLSGAGGEVLTAAPVQEALLPGGFRPGTGFTRFGVALDRRWGALDASLAASWVSEDRTVLGAWLHEALGARGADSLFLDAKAGWNFAEDWSLGAAWRQGFTRARAAGFVGRGSHMSSDSWALDVERGSAFVPGDSLALRLSQPLRVRSGGIGFALPVAYSYETLSATQGVRRLSLAPHGREITTELRWRGPLWGGAASTSLFVRTDPGHYANLPAEQGMAISWKAEF